MTTRLRSSPRSAARGMLPARRHPVRARHREACSSTRTCASTGPGNLGATNVFRVLGPVGRGFVLFLDIAKGAVGACASPRVLIAVTGRGPRVRAELVPAARGVRRRGGPRATRRTFGFRAARAWPRRPVRSWSSCRWRCSLLTALFVARGRRCRACVSLGSVVAAVAFPFVAVAAVLAATPPLVALTVVAAALVVWRHRGNIGRIIDG